MWFPKTRVPRISLLVNQIYKNIKRSLIANAPHFRLWCYWGTKCKPKWRINTCEQKLVLCPILLQLPDQPAVHVLNSVALINDDVPPIGRPKILWWNSFTWQGPKNNNDLEKVACNDFGFSLLPVINQLSSVDFEYGTLLNSFVRQNISLLCNVHT